MAISTIPGCDNCTAGTLFEQASLAFDGWQDRETGLRVLRIADGRTEIIPGLRAGWHWRTTYHQYLCFLDGGRQVLLRTGEELLGVRTADSHLVDLTTGQISQPFPADYYPIQVNHAGLAILYAKTGYYADMVLWDIAQGRALATVPSDGWSSGWSAFLCDGQRAVFAQCQGEGGYAGHYRTRFFLVGADGSVEQVLQDDDAICNHVQGHPSDPLLIAYDRWPTPYSYTPQVIRLRRLDTGDDWQLPLNPGVMVPGQLLGGQRDHFLWTTDGTAIASYVSPLDNPEEREDHFDYDWHVSVLNWQTGEDVCVKYPPHRWGCNFTLSPDGRYIVTGGGKQFQRLYRIDIDGLRQGWNEHVFCTFPHTEVDGDNMRLFHMPWVLPDQSGVLFTAGWYGPETGVYLVEWPRE